MVRSQVANPRTAVSRWVQVHGVTPRLPDGSSRSQEASSASTVPGSSPRGSIVVRRPVTPRAAADTSAPTSPRTWQYRRNARSEHAKYWPALADRPPDSSATTAAETSPGVIPAGSPPGA
jgi:hypothetical protein